MTKPLPSKTVYGADVEIAESSGLSVTVECPTIVRGYKGLATSSQTETAFYDRCLERALHRCPQSFQPENEDEVVFGGRYVYLMDSDRHILQPMTTKLTTGTAVEGESFGDVCFIDNPMEDIPLDMSNVSVEGLCSGLAVWVCGPRGDALDSLGQKTIVVRKIAFGGDFGHVDKESSSEFDVAVVSGPFLNWDASAVRAFEPYADVSKRVLFVTSNLAESDQERALDAAFKGSGVPGDTIAEKKGFVEVMFKKALIALLTPFASALDTALLTKPSVLVVQGPLIPTDVIEEKIIHLTAKEKEAAAAMGEARYEVTEAERKAKFRPSDATLSARLQEAQRKCLAAEDAFLRAQQARLSATDPEMTRCFPHENLMATVSGALQKRAMLHPATEIVFVPCADDRYSTDTVYDVYPKPPQTMPFFDAEGQKVAEIQILSNPGEVLVDGVKLSFANFTQPFCPFSVKKGTVSECVSRSAVLRARGAAMLSHNDYMPLSFMPIAVERSAMPALGDAPRVLVVRNSEDVRQFRCVTAVDPVEVDGTLVVGIHGAIRDGLRGVVTLLKVRGADIRVDEIVVHDMRS